MIGFMSVLVYYVSASDGLKLGHLPATQQPTDLASLATRPMTVEFIIQQSDLAAPRPAPEQQRASGGSGFAAIANQFVLGEGVPEFKLEVAPVIEHTAALAPSPSIIYIN